MNGIVFTKVLSYGSIGLASILALMAYRLLANEQKKNQPSDEILKSIRNFMIFTVVLALIGLVSELVRTYKTTDTTTQSSMDFSDLQKYEGQWCEIEQYDLNGRTPRFSCFEIGFDDGKNIYLQGKSYVNGRHVADWQAMEVTDSVESTDAFIYSYTGKKLQNNAWIDTTYSVSKLDFKQESGWYMSSTRGKINFKLAKLSNLEAKFNITPVTSSSNGSRYIKVSEEYN